MQKFILQRYVDIKKKCVRLNQEPGYFDDALFLPFNVGWQITVITSVAVSIATVYMITFFMDCKERFKDVEVVDIDSVGFEILVYSAEVIFCIDFILLAFHKFMVTKRKSMPYTEVKCSYIIVSLIGLIPVGFITSFKPKYPMIFTYIKLLIVFRMYRVFLILKYFLNSVYLNVINIMLVLAVLFVILLSTIASLFYKFVWATVRSDVADKAEEALSWIVPMLNNTVFSTTFQIKTQLDLFIIAIYVTGNSFLTRGLVNYSMYKLLFQLIYQMVVLVSMFFFKSLIGLFAAIKIHNDRKVAEFRVEQETVKWAVKRSEEYVRIAKNIDRWYDAFWSTRKGINESKMKKLLPSSLYQDCMLDMYWPAFIHSHIFRNLDIQFLSAVSLKMRTVFYCAGDVVVKKGVLRDKMIYVLRGKLHAMSSFDKFTPIVSFSSGSCIGESTLLVSYPCVFEITCATNCELQELKKCDFLQIRHNFPQQIKRIEADIWERYHEVLLLYSMKSIKRSKNIACLIGLHDDGALKKIKRIARDIERYRQEKVFTKYDQQDRIFKMLSLENIKPNYIGSTSKYLDMTAISHSETSNSLKTFITTTFPMILHPISPFVKIWNALILICILIMFFMIPYEAGVDTVLDKFQIVLSIYIQIIFILDLLIQCTFAVITNERSYKNVSEIFFYRISTLEYKVDIFASIPVNLIVISCMDIPINLWGLLKLNYVLRAWRYTKIFQDLIHESLNFKKVIALIVYVIYFFCSVCYWSLVFSLLSTYDNDLKENTMWKMTEKNAEQRNNYLDVIVKTMVSVTLMCLGVSGGHVIPYSREEHISVLLMVTYFLILNSFFIAGISIIEILKIRTKDISCDTVKGILKFVENYDLSLDLQFRIYQQISVVRENLERNANFKQAFPDKKLPEKLRYEIKLASMLDYILEVPLFCRTDAKYVSEIADGCTCRLFPPNEFVVYGGVLPQCLYIIKRGYCQLLSSQSGNVEGIKGPGWCIAALELVMNIPSLKTVKTLTCCEMIVLQSTFFFCTLHRFPEYEYEIKITIEKTKQLLEIPIVEGFYNRKITTNREENSFHHFGYNMPAGSKREREFLNPYHFYLGNLTVLNYFLLRSVILPSGKAIWILEIIRGVSAIFSGLLFPAKIIMISYSSYYENLFNFLDFLAYLDLYLRLHVGYYNDEGILIKHPLLTAIYYIKHGFLIDFLACVPIERLFSHVLPYRHASYWLCYNRVLQIHRPYGFLDHIYVTTLRGKVYSVILIYCILLVVVINLLTSVYFTSSCNVSENIYKTNEDFEMVGVDCPGVIKHGSFSYITFGKILTPRNVYFMFEFYITVIVTQINVYGIGKWDDDGMFTIFACFIGYTITLFMIGETSAQTVVHKVGMDYQRKIKSLTAFLNKSKVSKELKSEFIHHFNMIWDHYQGKNPKDTIAILNNTLRADIIYHIYGKNLRDYTIFAQSDIAFFRSLLLLFNPHIFHKNSFVLQEGFVHNEIYLLCEGLVTVYCGKTPVMNSGKGTFFGNLFNQNSVQQSVAIFAQTNVEVLVISTKDLYFILDAYPHDKQYYLKKLQDSTRQGISIIPGIIDDDLTFSRITTGVNKESILLSLKFNLFKSALRLISSFSTCYMIALHETTILALLFVYIIDLIHLLFMVLEMHTPYRNSIGELETDLPYIRINYRSKTNGFWFDLFTALPFESFWFLFKEKLVAFTFLRLNKLFRFVQFVIFCERFPQKLTSKQAAVKILILSLYFYSVIFFFACSFLTIYTYNEYRFGMYLCYHRLKYFAESVTVMLCNFAKYPSHLNVLYSRESVLLFRCCQMILTVLIGGIVTGYILFFIEMYFFDILEYLQVKKDILLTVNINETSNVLCKSVKTYLQFLWYYNNGSQTPDIIYEAPKPLQMKLNRYLYEHHIKNHSLFSDCHDKFCEQLLLYLKVQLILPGSVIVKHGIIDNNIYFIHKGEVEVCESQTDKSNHVIHILLENDHFGTETGLRELPHQYTFKARSLVTVLILNFHSWSYLLDHFPVDKMRMYKSLNKNK